MTATTFFRLLHVPIEAKDDALAEAIAARNGSPLPESGEGPGVRADTYTLDPAAFSQIPGSPFAYWVGDDVRRLFTELSTMEAEGRIVRQGMVSADDFRFIRAWWEVPLQIIAYSSGETRQGRRWVHFAKGGVYSPYHADVHLVVDWESEGDRIRNFFKPDGRLASRPQNIEHFFRPGLTWPRRTTSGISVRALPRGCIFADKGPTAFVPNDDPGDLLALLAVMNSAPFEALVKLQLGAATAAARSYEVGLIQSTPIPDLTDHASRTTLAALACEAHDLQRDRDRADETTHAFCIPGLVMHRDAPTLRDASAALDAEEAARQSRLAAIQAQIDDIVFDLYGLREADRALIRREAGSWKLETDETGNWKPEAGEEGIYDEEEADDEDEQVVNRQSSIVNRVQDLLMWCVGVAFGRWDVRKALAWSPSSSQGEGQGKGVLPPLGGPFDPLPRYAPGALIDDFGLTIDDSPRDQSSIVNRQSSIEYPPDGILVDDPSHPSDIVRRVREVLELLWGERAEAVEDEACAILGVTSLREYFRDPRRFFAYHIKRYSKSRRKAPIYWLLQSERRSYGIWLYYHRITPMTLYIAGRDYADGKIALERSRLDDLRAGLDALSGSARRNREREIERQEKLVAEVTAFGKTLDKIALLNLPPDPNDGVLISIAPLHPLVPWKEAERMWQALKAGQYGWSTMAKRLTIVDRRLTIEDGGQSSIVNRQS